jgi:hypothetical protein
MAFNPQVISCGQANHGTHLQAVYAKSLFFFRRAHIPRFHGRVFPAYIDEQLARVVGRAFPYCHG